MYPRNYVFGRTRIKASDPRTSQYLDEWKNNGSTVYSYLSPPLRHETGSRMMGDVDTPGFYGSRRLGKIRLNHMVYDQCKSRSRPFVFRLTAIQGGSTFVDYTSYRQHPRGEATQGFTDSTLAWNYLEDAHGYKGLRDAAIVKSWSKIDESSMAALATLGELPETVSWIRSVLKRIVDIIRVLRGNKRAVSALKNYLNSPTKVLDASKDVWLEWRYALRPLIFEFNNAIKALKAKLEKGSRQTARGYTYDIGSTTTTQHVGSYGSLEYDWVTTTKKRVEFRAGVLYDLSEALNDLTTVFGLDQPLEAVWELIPFSFILDWVFNIGNVLSSWSTGLGLSPLGSWVTGIWIENTSCYSHSHTLTWEIYGYQTQSFEYIHYPSYSLERTLKQRWIDPSRAVLPSFKLRLDIQKILDLAAIGRQLLKAKR